MVNRKTLSVIVVALLLLCTVCKTTHELREPVDLPLDDIQAVVVDGGAENGAGAVGAVDVDAGAGALGAADVDRGAGALGAADVDAGAGAVPSADVDAGVDEGAASGEPGAPDDALGIDLRDM